MKHLQRIFAFIALLAISSTFASATTDTIPGYALSFNGSQYVNTGNSADFNLTGSFTVEAWFKISNWNSAWQVLLAKGDFTWRIHRNSSTNTLAFGTNDLSSPSDLLGTMNVNDGQWHHVAVVYNQTTSTKYLYVDGNLDVTQATIGNLNVTTDAVMFGRNSEYIERDYRGSLDEVRIWTVARSADDIRASMHRTLSGDETGLLSYYQFNEGSGSSTTDAQGLHNGTLNTPSLWTASTVPIGWEYVNTSPMVYLSSTTTQITSNVFRGAINKRVISIQVVASGAIDPLNVTQIELSTNGTTNSAEITNAKLFWTGTSSTFATTTQFGSTVAAPNGAFTVTGSQPLSSGTNYFWLTYDISSSAAGGNSLDAECSQITIGDEVKIPNVVAPSGALSIVVLDTVPGYALQLNAASGFLVNLGNQSAFAFSGSFTVEAWIRVTSFNKNWQAIVTKGDNSWRLTRYNNTNTLCFGTNGLSNVELVGTTNVNDGKWHHVAAVYDGSAKYLYVDGKLDAITFISSGTLSTNSAAACIGGNSQVSDRSFNGRIDEVRFWNIARTQQQIRESMNRTLNGSENGFVSYYQFNEPGMIDDFVGQHEGTLYNAPEGYNAWTVATLAPVGGGSSMSQSSFTAGTANLGTVSLTTTDDFDAAIDITAIEIDQAPNQTPSGYSTLLTNRYWIVNTFGTPGTFSTDLSFTFGPDVLNPLGDTNPEGVKLYKRDSNSDGVWTYVTDASSVNSSTGVVTFNGITSFSQFVVVEDESALPVELVSFTATPQRLNTQLLWKTATEVNNYGFEVERAVVSKEYGVESGHAERSEASRNWIKVGFVEGNGTTNAPKEYSFTDKNPILGKYSYRLKQIDRDGKFSYSKEVEVEIGNVPNMFALEQNFPNPFNPSTVINYQLPVTNHVTLKVYDVLGKEVATLVNEVKEAGSYSVQLSANSYQLASGMFFYTLRSGSFTATKKLLLMK